MSLLQDVLFSMKPRCPVCRTGRLFKPFSTTVVEHCEHCSTNLGDHDVGDGAAVFLMWMLSLTIIPAAWVLELLAEPPLWLHAVLWGGLALVLTVIFLPAVKAYIILLQYRHRPGDWEKADTSKESE